MAWPCPCCGHRTLPSGPGDYELCPVCWWEDDGGQLRYPLRNDGANGESLVVAQRRHRRGRGLLLRLKGKTRRPRPDEPLDPDWRPFDPARDWTDPTLESERMPRNPEALYWWRPTYWNGDPDTMPPPPREVTSADRLVERLRRELPEAAAVIEKVDWTWGRVAPFRVCEAMGELAVAAYRGGDPELGDRIAAVMNGGLADEEILAPMAVREGFLGRRDWHDPDLEHVVDRWPAELAQDLRRQRVARVEADAEALVPHPWVDIPEALHDLAGTHRGRPLPEAVATLGAALEAQGVSLDERTLTELAARATEPGWRWRHPIRARRTRDLRHLRLAG
ncbi:CPCC family cysteine-rich protein [Nocardioides pacificus]